MHQIDSLYKNIEAEARVASSKDVQKKETKDEKKSKETELSSEQKALYQAFKKMQKMLLLPVQRVRNLFCKSPEGHIVFPRAIADAQGFNLSESFKMIEAAHAYLSSLYGVDAEKNKKVLDEQIDRYDEYSMEETKAFIAYIQEYAKILVEYTFEDEDLPFNPEPSGDLKDRKDKRGINKRLQQIVQDKKYAVLRVNNSLKELPHAESRQDFIGDQKNSNDAKDWALDKKQEEVFLKYLGKICYVQFGLINRWHALIQYEYPTEHLLKNFKEVKDLVEKYLVSDTLNTQIKKLVEKALDNEENKKNQDLVNKLTKIKETFLDTSKAQKNIKDMWVITT
jgi:hypothetical protein